MSPTSAHRLAFGTVIVACLVAGCGGVRHRSSPGPRHPRGTVWVCRPGQRADPCVSDLTTTLIRPGGAEKVEHLKAARDAPVDCFYVYPTVSAEPTVNADLAVGLREREVAVAQAAPFSRVCRVYAPAYRQITLSALDHPARIKLRNALIAYRSVASAFHWYLVHDNHGRGIVFIGHSQGAAILARLLRLEVDPVPALRRRLVSALLLGGNITVAAGRTTGGDFRHIPACTAVAQTGCVVAYSSFAGTPPKNSQFGRTTSDAGVALLAPPNHSPRLRIMCVNPAALGGGSGLLEPALPSLALTFLSLKGIPLVTTPWAALPGRFSARCRTAGNASWLQVKSSGSASSLLTRLREPLLGLHVLDVTIALDNLVRVVHEQAHAYSAR